VKRVLLLHAQWPALALQGRSAGCDASAAGERALPSSFACLPCDAQCDRVVVQRVLKPEHLKRIFNDFLGMDLREVRVFVLTRCCLLNSNFGRAVAFSAAQKQLQAVLDQIDINDDKKVVLQDLWKSTVSRSCLLFAMLCAYCCAENRESTARRKSTRTSALTCRSKRSIRMATGNARKLSRFSLTALLQADYHARSAQGACQIGQGAFSSACEHSPV
jgi:hypothetical protein